MKVFGWIDADKPPGKPTVDDMRYGLGCMNDLAIVMADLFKESMMAMGELTHPSMKSPLEMIEDLDKAAFSRLWNEFASYCKGNLVSEKKVEKAISERNYFIRVYQNEKPAKDDGKRLFDLIKLLAKINKQLTNVRDRICKKKKKEIRIENDSRREELVKIIHSCKQFEPGWVYLGEIGNVLKKQNIRLDGKLGEVMNAFGWKLHEIPDSQALFCVRVDDIR